MTKPPDTWHSISKIAYGQTVGVRNIFPGAFCRCN